MISIVYSDFSFLIRFKLYINLRHEKGHQILSGSEGAINQIKLRQNLSCLIAPSDLVGSHQLPLFHRIGKSYQLEQFVLKDFVRTYVCCMALISLWVAIWNTDVYRIGNLAYRFQKPLHGNTRCKKGIMGRCLCNMANV